MIKDYIEIVDITSSDNHVFYQPNTPKEISISLFGECNMNCEFCIGNQRHGIRCPDNFDHVIALANAEIAKTDKHMISVVLYGGELFHDGIKDSTFDQYRQLVSSITEFANKSNKSIQWTISANLVHKKRDRVLALLKDLNINSLCSSFDFEQRFTNEKLLQTFLDNVQWYTDHQINLSFGFILFNANINAFYNKHRLLPIFDQLYEKYPIYFDYYHPTNRDTNIVDEKTIGEFLIWLEQHYPNIKTLTDIRNKNHRTGCPATFIIDNVATRCCDFKIVAKKYAIKKQCFNCQYSNVCCHPCIRVMSNSSDCFVKIYYDYLESINK